MGTATMRPLAILWALFILACGPDSSIPSTAPLGTQHDITLAVTMTDTVMRGLNSPRGLAFGPDGALYVAEAGTAVASGPCIPVVEAGMNVTKCPSGTGSISRWRRGVQSRVINGLPSFYVQQSGFATGPNDISFNGLGNAFVPIGWGANPGLRGNIGALGEFAGTLIKLAPAGDWRVVADVAGFESLNNPAGGPVDSNPYGVLVERSERFVADAGGNTLFAVAANGDLTLVTTFPKTTPPSPFVPAEAVPTKVARGPDGALYVSTLTGVPFLAGTAAIYRVIPGEAPEVYETGFKTLTDLAFDAEGNLYVTQYGSNNTGLGGPGLLIRIAAGNSPRVRTVISSTLLQPTCVEPASDGALYVCNRSTSIGNGQVLRITTTN